MLGRMFLAFDAAILGRTLVVGDGQGSALDGVQLCRHVNTIMSGESRDFVCNMGLHQRKNRSLSIGGIHGQRRKATTGRIDRLTLSGIESARVTDFLSMLAEDGIVDIQGRGGVRGRNTEVGRRHRQGDSRIRRYIVGDRLAVFAIVGRPGEDFLVAEVGKEGV